MHLNTYLTLTKINKYYIYDDQSLYIFFSSLIFWVWLFVTHGIDLVSIPRYYILVSYRSQNYGIEPSLAPRDLHSYLSINNLIFHLPVVSGSVYDRRPDLHRHSHGSPVSLTRWYPGGAGQHSSDLAHANSKHSICLCQSHGYACHLRGWFVWVWRFLLQVALCQEMQPQKFLRESSKVALFISLLSGRVLLWAKAIWNTNTAIINSYQASSKHFSEVFGQTTWVLSVSDQLLRLRQSASSTKDYTLQFRTLAATFGWNEVALLKAYRQGLDPCIRAQMTIFHDFVGLESFMQKANLPHLRSHSPTCLTRQWSSSTRTHTSRFHPAFSWGTACRLAAGICLYCATTDHYLGTCPIRLPRPPVLFSQNLSFPRFPCSQYNSSLQSITWQPSPLSTRAPRATSSRRICWVAYICLATAMPRSSESKRSKKKRLDVGMWSIILLMWSWSSAPCMKRRSHSWYWRDQLWTSSWDAPGSHSILQRSDGTPVRWFAGANSAINTASRNCHIHSTSHLLSRSLPQGLRALSLVSLPWSHLIMWCSRMSSERRQPANYHLIGHGTVPLTCSLEINSLRVEYTHCPSWSAMEE